MTDLTYDQRLQLGRITARRQFADEARAQAMTAMHIGDEGTALTKHAEADQHEAAILDASIRIGQIHYINHLSV